MSSKFVPLIRFDHESWVKNSRFISHIGPAFSVDEAKSFISDINREYPDASHNVPAYIIGFGSSVIEHSSDDGEPSGTAGRPALAVIRGSGLGDTVLVITRYFGGTKLGTGGLVKAYGNAARAAVKLAPKAAKITTHRVELISPYNLYEQIIRLIRLHHGLDPREDFTDMVRIQLSIPSESFDSFNTDLLELSKGSVRGVIIEENQTSLLPVRNQNK